MGLDVKLLEYLKSGKYLPPEIQDFHDAKDLFKTIGNRETGDGETVNWRQGQVYVIDHFLWFMAIHGFELKAVRSNNKIPRINLHETIAEYKAESAKAFREYLAQNKTEPTEHNDQLRL